MTRSKLFCLLLVLLACGQAGWAQDTLSPGDRIRVWVKGEPELTVERTINADGTIAYPLLGSVELGGRKPVEAARLIAKALDDGFLREPLVQVNLVNKTRTSAPQGKPAADDEPMVAGEPLAAPETSRARVQAETPAPGALPSPCQIEIVDRKTGKGVGGAAMLLGGKIYQSNRLGQVVIDQAAGRVILLADGYGVVQGPIDQVLRVGPPHQILLDPIVLADEITVKVVDAVTRQPLSDVEIRLDKMMVKTNAKGIFKVREIKREFAEIRLSRRGYRPARKILDFKDPLEQVLVMVKNE